jgi:hypothetical protein
MYISGVRLMKQRSTFTISVGCSTMDDPEMPELSIAPLLIDVCSINHSMTATSAKCMRHSGGTYV